MNYFRPTPADLAREHAFEQTMNKLYQNLSATWKETRKEYLNEQIDKHNCRANAGGSSKRFSRNK